MGKSYRKIFEETEIKTQNKNDSIAKKIITQIEQIYGVKLKVPGSPMTYPMIIQTILFVPTYCLFRNKLIDLLDEYKVCEKNIILRYLSIINQPGMTEEARSTFETSFLSLPYFEYYEKVENGCIIETKNGVIEAYNLTSLLDKNVLYRLIKENRYRQLCHIAVEECVDYYPEHRIITSEIPALFKGGYYHSYYKSSNDEEVVDIASNMLYKNGSFDQFYKPHELLNIEAKDLQKEYSKIKTGLFPSQMAKTLELALENKRKKK